MFNFNKQLEIGREGEAAFTRIYPRKLEPGNSRKYDFIISSSRETLEVKTDTYDINKTDNYFFERYSDVKRKTLGGPWRALNDNVDIFCYYFINSGIYFEFRNIKQLIKYLDKLVKKRSLVYIRNGGWTTAGYLIKREEVLKFVHKTNQQKTQDNCNGHTLP